MRRALVPVLRPRLLVSPRRTLTAIPRRTLTAIPRRTLVAIPVVLLALAGAAAGTENQLQVNRAAAKRDARKLLTLVRLPQDVQPSAARPRVGGTLVGENSASSSYWARAQAFWTTDADPRSIIAYVKAHKPQGSKIETWGSSTAPDTPLFVAFNWPDVGQKLDGRMLTVSVISAPGGPSAIVAESQSSGVTPRPSGERVPSAVTRVAISLRLGTGPEGRHHMHISTYVVWRESRVAALVNNFNNLLIVQPGEMIACPLILTNGPQLTLRFKDASGHTLARSQVNVYPGPHGGSGSNSCDAIQFWIGGKQQTALTSDTFVKQIGQLIGANIS